MLKHTKSLVYSGFIIKSKDMTLKLSEKEKKYDLFTKIFEKPKPTIWFVAQVISNIDASCPAVPLEPSFYRDLETDKIVGLKRHRQNLWHQNWIIT